MLSQKGLATKILFWLVLGLIVGAVLLFLMGKIGITVGNFDLFGEQKLSYVHLPTETDFTMTLEARGDSIIKGIEEREFIVYSDISMKNSDRLPREGIDIIISFQSYMKGADFTGCRVEKRIKPGEEIRVYSSECINTLRLSPEWSGPVNIKAVLIDKKTGSAIVSKDAVIESYIRLSTFGSGNLALCRALNEYKDYANSMLYLQNDVADLSLTCQKEQGTPRIRMKINNEICESPSLYDYVGDAELRKLVVEPNILINSDCMEYVIRKGGNLHIYSSYGSTMLDASYG